MKEKITSIIQSLNPKKRFCLLIYVEILLILLTNIFTYTNEHSKNFNLESEIVNNELIYTSDEINNININIPRKGNMIPQGLTTVNNYFLISAYDYKNKKDSIIYVLNKKGKIINTCDINQISHVGGIAFDNKNKLIWIAGKKGHVTAYRVEDIISQSNAYPTYDFFVGEGLINYKNDKESLISSVAYKESSLYVGSFSLNGGGLAKKYNILNNNGKISLEHIHSFKIPNKVQGITFYKKNGREYIFFSISYGRNNTSKIKSYVYDDSTEDYTNKILKGKTYKLPPMLEQIVINGELIYALYESNAKVYNNCPEKSEKIAIINVKELINY